MAKANIRQIEAFNSVMKTGSVTRAAEAMFVSQPAVTKLLQSFEAACGFKLFSRATGRLVPTPEARQLFAETEKLETGLLRVQNAARAISRRERGQVSVVGFPGISMQFIPREVAAILAERPDVSVTLLTRTSPSIEGAMIAEAADLGLSLLPTDSPALQCRPFAELSMICGLPAGHPLASRAEVSLEDLKGEKLVALGREDLSYAAIAAGFHRLGISMSPTAEVQMLEAACAMVSAGYGVTIVLSLAAAGPPDPNIVFRPLAQRITMQVWLVTSRFGELSQLALELIDVIRRALDALESSFASPLRAP